MDYRHDTKAFSYTHLTDSSLDRLSTNTFNEDVDDELSEKLFSKFPSFNGHSAAHLNKRLALRQKFYDSLPRKTDLFKVSAACLPLFDIGFLGLKNSQDTPDENHPYGNTRNLIGEKKVLLIFSMFILECHKISSFCT